MLQESVSLGEALPPNPLARFIVDVITQLDLSGLYGRYAPIGGEALAPEILLGVLFYGYATGVFSSRKLERATYERLPFRFIARGLHPDHDTLATFRKTFLAEIEELFVQILLLAQAVGVLKRGKISLDGSKIQADASKSKALSYKRLGELATQLRHATRVQRLMTLGEQVDQGERAWPEGRVLQDERARREDRLAQLAEAKAILEARAAERYAAEQAEYEAKVREGEEKARRRGRKPGGRAPKPPEPGPRDTDPYNFTDPEARIMTAKRSTDAGFDQPDNVQAAVDQDSLWIVAPALSNHPNDKAEAEPTLAALSPERGGPTAAALDHGDWSEPNRQACEQRGMEAYIATGREPHPQSWETFFAEQPAPPPDDASPKEKMAASRKLKTEMGQAI